MDQVRVFVTGMGVVSPAGNGCRQTLESLLSAKAGIRPISLFPVTGENPLPVGEVIDCCEKDNSIPRTHALALLAAKEAMANEAEPLDAVVIGVTTGGMLKSEQLLKENNLQPALFAMHSTDSVTKFIANHFQCKGPALTVSTACSSGAVALIIALELLRNNIARRVLAGGVDSLCRLTYYGFNSLQLIDPQGARPFDSNRKGMSVGEGAAMLLLEAFEKSPPNALAQIMGRGLSCDAFHPTAPHPEGAGAIKAMNDAIKDAGITPFDIDYINLHGTGTLDNDISEAKAIRTLFGKRLPALSSTKGMTGHLLAAAGAVEAVISIISISENIIPPNIGCTNPDPQLGITPKTILETRSVHRVLSNSFGFGGNNAAVVLGTSNLENFIHVSEGFTALKILGTSCITGAGMTEQTYQKFINAEPLTGIMEEEKLSSGLPPRVVRRLKRLPKISLSLAVAAHHDANIQDSPTSVFFGTGWGALSETYDFLKKLFDTDEKFVSPTDFVGSVHNAPAGQISLLFKSTGANVTASGGDYSFEQSVLMASLLSSADEKIFLVGADEFHPVLSPLLDASVSAALVKSDGGGALITESSRQASGMRLMPMFYQICHSQKDIIDSLIEKLHGAEKINEKYASLFVGFPYACQTAARSQLEYFVFATGFSGPVIDYRSYTGEYATASATAAVLAIRLVKDGRIPAPLARGKEVPLQGRGILMLSFGEYITAIEVCS
jgi:3-oxoacyl-(acyl-carrier-protein) synthase